MKRISARILPLLISVALLPSVLAEAKTQRSPAAKSVRAATVKAPTKARLPVKVKTPVQKASVAPGLPDRNPLRAASPATPAAEAQEAAGASPAPSAAPDIASDPQTTAGLQNTGTSPASETPSASTTIAKKSAEEADRNPTPPSLIGSPALPLPEPPAPRVATDMPLPDANPSRTGGLDTLQGTLAPAIAPERPALDYPSILKPILSYEISDSDEANFREVLRSGPSAASRINDPAVRDFALWYKYRNSPASGKAEAIENFRLVHPDWPGQDEL